LGREHPFINESVAVVFMHGVGLGPKHKKVLWKVKKESFKGPLLKYFLWTGELITYLKSRIPWGAMLELN